MLSAMSGRFVVGVSIVVAAIFAAGCLNGPAEPPVMDRAAHCPERIEITCAEDVGGTFPLRVSGNTLEGDDGYGRSACGGGGDAVLDHAYRWTAPWSGRFVITTEGSSFDTVLSVRQGSCAGRELICNDDAGNVGGSSEVTVDLNDCQTVTIVVDGGLGASIEGSYQLAIRALETNCDDDIDGDLDGLTDCDDDDCFTARCLIENPGMDPDRDWPEEWAGLEWTVLELTNQRRAEGASCDGERFDPAPPLEADPLLRRSARLHSTDMGENNYFDHVSLDGRMLTDRIAATGFTGAGPWGENIARGYATAEAVVEGWMTSPGHCRNIMNPAYHALGVGLAYSPGGEPFWTQNFAGGR